MDRANFDLELIQRILGHSDPEMTLTYIDPWQKRIEVAFKKIFIRVKPPKYKDDLVYEK